MAHIKDLRSGIELFKALGSDVRIEILELLSEFGSLNMNEIARKLNLTNGAVTMHIKKLKECGLIDITTTVGKHGIQKICFLNEGQLTIDLSKKEKMNLYEVEIKVGHYCDYEADITCGLATKDYIIGEFDEPRYLSDPDRINAEIVWLTKGYLEYRIPNYLKPNHVPKELQIILEFSSEADCYNDDYPSDILFSINQRSVGSWISPGDFGSTRGLNNPAWWPPHLNQYGLLKLLRINEYGSYMDGNYISSTTIEDLALANCHDIKFRISVGEYMGKFNGLTIFGKEFGNYKQHIIARVLYDVR